MVCTVLLLASSLTTIAQVIPDHPIVGKSCPDFTLTDVNFFKQKIVSLKDFHGKWLVLDCWNRYCSNCISSMPRMDSIRKEFKNQIEVVYIGYTGNLHAKESDNKEIRILYERVQREYNLDLPMAFDSLLMDRFKIAATPYIIIIDPNGIVRAITTHIDRIELNKIIRGEKVFLKKAYRWQKGVGRIE